MKIYFKKIKKLDKFYFGPHMRLSFLCYTYNEMLSNDIENTNKEQRERRSIMYIYTLFL